MQMKTRVSELMVDLGQSEPHLGARLTCDNRRPLFAFYSAGTKPLALHESKQFLRLAYACESRLDA